MGQGPGESLTKLRARPGLGLWFLYHLGEVAEVRKDLSGLRNGKEISVAEVK